MQMASNCMVGMPAWLEDGFQAIKLHGGAAYICRMDSRASNCMVGMPTCMARGRIPCITWVCLHG